MKKLLLSVIVLSVTFCFSTYAQYIVSYSAIDGIEVARNKAKTTEDDELKLLMIMTSNGELELNGIPLPIKFDINTGKCEYWIYAFINTKDTTEIRFIAVLKFLGNPLQGFNANIVGYDVTRLNISEMIKLDSINWIGSDSLVERLKVDDDFMEFYGNNNQQTDVSLSINTDNPLLNFGEPYWQLTIGSDSFKRTCFVNAISGDITCDEITSVESNSIEISNDLLIYPNPANDYINIRLPETSNNLETQFSIFDIYGRELERFSSIPQNNEIRHILDQKVFSNGVYYLQYSLKNQNFSVPFVIER